MSGWATLREHQYAVRTLGFAPNGQQLVSGDEGGVVVVWSLLTRRPIVVWDAHQNALLTTKFWGVCEHLLVVTHGRDNLLCIWDIEKIDSQSRPLLLYQQDVNALNFCSVALAPINASSSHWVLAAPASTASERIDVYALDPETYQLHRPFKALDAADVLPLDTQLENEDMSSQRRGLLGAVMVMQFTIDKLVAGYESGHVAMFNRESGNVVFLAQVHRSPILSLELVVQGEILIAYVTASNRKISRVNLISGDMDFVAKLQHRGVSSVSINDGLMVTAGWDGQARLFELDQHNDSWVEKSSFSGMKEAGITTAVISAVESSPRRRLKPLPSQWIAVAGKNGRIALFSISTELVPR